MRFLTILLLAAALLTAQTAKKITTPRVTATPQAKSVYKAPPVKTQRAHPTTQAKTVYRGQAPKATRAQAPRITRTRYRYVPTRPVVQQQPSPDRYREIQQALIDRGYLRQEATGQWDDNSTNALNRFKQDQNLKVDGKLDSLSLIALGLGPKKSTYVLGSGGTEQAPASTLAQ